MPNKINIPNTRLLNTQISSWSWSRCKSTTFKNSVDKLILKSQSKSSPARANTLEFKYFVQNQSITLKPSKFIWSKACRKHVKTKCFYLLQKGLLEFYQTNMKSLICMNKLWIYRKISETDEPTLPLYFYCWVAWLATHEWKISIVNYKNMSFSQH